MIVLKKLVTIAVRAKGNQPSLLLSKRKTKKGEGGGVGKLFSGDHIIKPSVNSHT